MRKSLLILLMLLLSPVVFAQSWEFTLHKHASGIPGPTLLVIGGIQGDEPGGFNAASLLTTEYRITRGEVWVVPNLNFESIIKRSRGVHGDMNRKFKDIQSSDPEFELVQKIKKIITNPQVDLILNLHDGSGFYRPVYVDRKRNPNRWGQSLIIDQEQVDGVDYGDLGRIASQIVNRSNVRINRPGHYYHVKNTQTRLGNREMEKTLTYYAIQNGKSAFGIEASKTFDTHYRAFYHLLMIESFLDFLGIEYDRKFDLTFENVNKQINENIRLALYGDRIRLDMRNARKRLNYVPIKKDAPINYVASNPLIAVLDKKNAFHVRYGNRSVTRLVPQFYNFDDSLSQIDMQVDGEVKTVSLGDIVNVRETFQVLPLEGYRVNVIGYTRTGIRSEDGIDISRKQIRKRYSIDRHAHMFRVEIYSSGKFCGMVIVNFDDHPVARLEQDQNSDS